MLSGEFVKKLGEELAVHIVSDLLTVAIGISLLLLISTYQWRRRLRRFFGVRRGTNGRVLIKLSNIWVRARGTLSSLPMSDGFRGYAITEPEYYYALRLARAVQAKFFFRFLRVISEHLLGKTADPPLVCEIGPSPRYVDIQPDLSETTRLPTAEIETMLAEERTLIAVGSPAYNVLTRYVLDNAEAEAHFAFTRRQIGEQFHRAVVVKNYYRPGADREFMRGNVDDMLPSEGETDAPPRTLHREYFVVQKFNRWHADGAGPTVFVCAGTSTSATVGALLQLTDWRALDREFEGKSFAILFELITPILELSNDDHEVLPPGWQVNRVWPTRRQESE